MLFEVLDTKPMVFVYSAVSQNGHLEGCIKDPCQLSSGIDCAQDFQRLQVWCAGLTHSASLARIGADECLGRLLGHAIGSGRQLDQHVECSYEVMCGST